MGDVSVFVDIFDVFIALAAKVVFFVLSTLVYGIESWCIETYRYLTDGAEDAYGVS